MEYLNLKHNVISKEDFIAWDRVWKDVHSSHKCQKRKRTVVQNCCDNFTDWMRKNHPEIAYPKLSYWEVKHWNNYQAWAKANPRWKEVTYKESQSFRLDFLLNCMVRGQDPRKHFTPLQSDKETLKSSGRVRYDGLFSAMEDLCRVVHQLISFEDEVVCTINHDREAFIEKWRRLIEWADVYNTRFKNYYVNQNLYKTMTIWGPLKKGVGRERHDYNNKNILKYETLQQLIKECFLDNDYLQNAFEDEWTFDPEAGGRYWKMMHSQLKNAAETKPRRKI